MLEAGHYYTLKVVKHVDFGCYLDASGDEVLLPKRFVPKGTKDGDEIGVFLYHDSESRLIATTQKPKAAVGEIALLKVVAITDHGAFMEWGIMKDLFVPLSQQTSRMYEGESYLVMPFVDKQTGRVAGTERFEKLLSNEVLTVKELEEVQLTMWQKTDIGYKVIINNKHTGVLHYSDVFGELNYGEVVNGFIKKIREDNKIDVKIGKRGFERVLPETDRILQALIENDGYLPLSDKSAPEEIYDRFGISKKTFKMAVGQLYKERKIELAKEGIKLVKHPNN